jgi:hypothetical protein
MNSVRRLGKSNQQAPHAHNVPKTDTMGGLSRTLMDHRNRT